MAFDMSMIRNSKILESREKVKACFSYIAYNEILTDCVKEALKSYVSYRAKTNMFHNNFDLSDFKNMVDQLLVYCCEKKILFITKDDVYVNEKKIIYQIKTAIKLRTVKKLYVEIKDQEKYQKEYKNIAHNEDLTVDSVKNYFRDLRL